jgi:hypothetical protein
VEEIALDEFMEYFLGEFSEREIDIWSEKRINKFLL